MISEEKIAQIANEHFMDSNQLTRHQFINFGRAIEAECRVPEGNEIDLNIIRKWPEGFQERLQHVWLDVVSFIPNVKLHDLQCVLAEYGFTMRIYETTLSAAPQPARADPVAQKPKPQFWSSRTI